MIPFEHITNNAFKFAHAQIFKSLTLNYYLLIPIKQPKREFLKLNVSVEKIGNILLSAEQNRKYTF